MPLIMEVYITSSFTGQLALTALVGSYHGFGHPDESLKVYFMERAEFWLCRRSDSEEHFCL